VRTTRRSASVLASVALLLWTSSTALSQPQSRTYEADCRTVVEGSWATGFCHNPYPETDRVRLHIECERWWDIDVDSAPVEIGPAGYAELTDRCWKEIRAVWVSHQPLRDSAGT
jgi:hypothetical protein